MPYRCAQIYILRTGEKLAKACFQGRSAVDNDMNLERDRHESRRQGEAGPPLRIAQGEKDFQPRFCI